MKVGLDVKAKIMGKAAGDEENVEGLGQSIRGLVWLE